MQKTVDLIEDYEEFKLKTIKLINKHPKLYSLCNSIVSIDSSYTEDILIGELFEKYHTTGAFLCFTSAFHCWVHIKRTLLSEKRRLDKVRYMEEDDDFYDTTNVDNELKLDIEILMSDLKKEDFELYTIIHMKFFEDMTYEAIAEELNLGVGSVKRRHQKAISLLRKLYKK